MGAPELILSQRSSTSFFIGKFFQEKSKRYRAVREVRDKSNKEYAINWLPVITVVN